MSCRVIYALVVLATSASGLQLSQQLPQLQSRRGWLANGIAVGAATLGAPKWTVADEGETATAEAAAAEATAVEPAAATPVAKDAEVDSLTKMLLERSEKNRAINADLVKKQSIQNGMGGVDGVQVSRTKEQPKGEGEGGGIPGSSFFKDATDKVYSSDDTVYATYMKNGAVVELTRPEVSHTWLHVVARGCTWLHVVALLPILSRPFSTTIPTTHRPLPSSRSWNGSGASPPASGSDADLGSMW
mmetsp:Transcript_18041/g.47471  ORF Transcript_18041/g.47471 Transcript_18041/m.47471 type:complete len:245 (-) Transcript_18041:2588-3322(-)